LVIVLVEGVSLVNKGAQLMLASIVERLHALSIEVAASPYIGSFRDRSRYGLLQAFEVKSIGRLGPIIQAAMRPNYRKLFGLATSSDCAALLDASGFFLGDQWKWSPRHERKRRRFLSFKGSNKPVIMMPQAFGPFEVNEKMTAFARDLLTCADLVYARDTSSLEHIQGIVPRHSGVRLAPDFTALLDGLIPPHVRLGDAPAAVIPNNQMLVHGQVGEDAYVRFLIDSIRLLREKRLDPFLLLHETLLDRTVAAKVMSCLPDTRVIEEPDPRMLKGILGRCVVTVGSRFHGLVSALSQGVPSLGTGWSHKYRELFADYGCPECLIDLRTNRNGMADAISDLLSTRECRQRALLERAKRIKERILEMWSEIYQTLPGPAS
jgi:hypothetical protein